MPAKIDSSIAGRPSGAGDLDEEVGALGLGVERLGRRDRRRGVVGEQRRDLERDPAVDAVGALVDGGEEVGGVAQVGDRQLEEEVLAAGALAAPCSPMARRSRPTAIALSKIDGFEVSPVTESSSM